MAIKFYMFKFCKDLYLGVFDFMINFIYMKNMKLKIRKIKYQ